jgi:hypothetical protein
VTTLEDAPRGYTDIMRIAKELGGRIGDYLAMSEKRDPFYAGGKRDVLMAQWFAGLWQQYGFGPGTHLRRVHYVVFSPRNVARHSGEPYDNTKADWQYLNDASRFARLLGLVNPEDIIDQRNPPAICYLADRTGGRPRFSIPLPDLYLPDIDLDGFATPTYELEEPTVSGYEYGSGDQPYHLEVWAEKTTMNDVLLPICQAMGANLITSAGFQSISAVIDLLRRAARSGKPVRIFYISDFDFSGKHMPKAVARQIEFWLPKYLGPAADVKLMQLALTREQVDAFNLPNAPGDTKSTNQKFEREQSRGVVELDALEALNPGALAQIAREALEPYIDRTLRRRLAETDTAVDASVAEQWNALIEPETERLAEIQEEMDLALTPLIARREELERAFQAALEPFETDLENVRHAASEKRETFDPELPPRPEPTIDEPDEDGWLFDSSRDWLDQIDAYSFASGAEDGDA